MKYTFLCKITKSTPCCLALGTITRSLHSMTEGVTVPSLGSPYALEVRVQLET